MASKNTGKSSKLVRDSFTIPKAEYLTIDALKTRAIAMGTSVKKSELLRAGLMVLKGMSDAAYKTAIAAVPTLKTGRPSAEVTPPKATTSVAKPAAKVALKKAAKPATKVEPAAKVAPKAVEKKVVAKKAVVPAARKPVAKTVAPKPKASAPAKAAVPAKQTVAVVKPVATNA
jgi:outer membrane biosynthesis protein TonB